MNSCSKALGEYIASTRYEDLPVGAVEKAKQCLADLIGIGLSGSRTEAAGIEAVCAAKSPAGQATVWGSGRKLSPEYAALANGTMTFHLELDDVHRTSHTHPGVSCIPAALALGECLHVSGRELLTAIVTAYDAVIRVGLAVSPSIYVDRTYLAPGTLSVFGAAAAAAKLRGLSGEQTGKAIGGASYFGPIACYESFRLGAGVKDMIMGWGNLCGMLSVDLAQAGFGGPDSAIEGDFGYCRTVAAKFDAARLYDGLGSRYEIEFTGVKPYACCRQHHAAIDCMLEMREKYGVGIPDVESIHVRTFTVSSRGNDPAPTTVPGAKYSIPYIMAVALRTGSAWRDEFTPELLRDGEIMDLARRVRVDADPELDKLYDEKWPSIVEMKLRDGRSVSARRDLPKGEPESPCTSQEIKAKFISLACDAVERERAEEIWQTISRLDQLEDVAELTKLLGA